MITEKEMDIVRNCEQVDLDEFFYGKLRIEDMEGYFRRELKENLLEQGYDLPEELKNPDDDTAPIPDYLRERPDPDIRSRYDGIYDGKEEDEEPHYGSVLYWQYQAVKQGRLKYIKAYNLDGEEIRVARNMFGELFIQVRDFLLSTPVNPIINFSKGYQWFCIGREHLDLDDWDEMAFITVYLF